MYTDCIPDIYGTYTEYLTIQNEWAVLDPWYLDASIAA
jgi:hypothetical protein